MSNIFSTDITPEKQGAPLQQDTLLETNREFRNEILAFRPQELLSECK